MVRAIRVASLLLWAATLVLASFAASAQRVEGDRAGATGLYSAEVQVNGQGAAERRNAFSRGLTQVLAKLSGDRAAASLPGVGQELRRAEGYVTGYDYRQDEGLSPSGAPSFRTTLVIRYDQERVDSLTAMLGVPVWPQPRPKPVLWLAIDDGRGPRLVGLPQSAAARSTLDRAVERGFRLGLPNGTAAEQAVVGAIWRGDTAAVGRASRPYSPPMQLVGKLYRANGGWTADWIFIDDGRVLSRWSESGADARRVMASGADGAADALTKRYAKRESAGPPGRYRVTFTGIDSSSDFMRVSGYLQGLAVVRDVTPLRATADALELELELLTGLPGLARAVQADEVLDGVPGGVPGGEDDPLQEPAQPTVYRLR